MESFEMDDDDIACVKRKNSRRKIDRFILSRASGAFNPDHHYDDLSAFDEKSISLELSSAKCCQSRAISNDGMLAGAMATPTSPCGTPFLSDACSAAAAAGYSKLCK